VTQVAARRRRSLRRLLADRDAPPSLQAQLVLMFSALLLGAVLTALLFVGIWRHTAADTQRARTAQLASRQQLHATQRKLAAAEAELAAEQRALAKARLGLAAATTDLGRLRRLHRSVNRSLRPELQAIADTTGTLAHTGSTLTSEIAALRAYLKSASTVAGSDFLDAQIRYLVASIESARASASTLAQQTRNAQAAAAKLH
jgi:chromosome segregation ATPase